MAGSAVSFLFRAELVEDRGGSTGAAAVTVVARNSAPRAPDRNGEGGEAEAGAAARGAREGEGASPGSASECREVSGQGLICHFLRSATFCEK